MEKLQVLHSPHMFLDEEDDDENFNEEEETDNRIRCPQKFFELLDLAEKYEIISMVEELSSDALKTLTITKENVIFTARIAKHYQKAFEDVSTKLLVRCLDLLLRRTSKAGDIWIRFWALINNHKKEDSEKQLRECLSLHEKLAGTPFVDLTISHALIKETFFLHNI